MFRGAPVQDRIQQVANQPREPGTPGSQSLLTVDTSGSEPIATWAMQLRRQLMKTIIMCDTQLGRDKSTRLFQHLCRMISGLTGDSGVAWQTCMNLAIMRRCLRFWKPVKLAKQIEDTLKNKKVREVDRALTVTEFGCFLIYCLMDHVRFAQNITLIRLKPQKYDLLDRFTEAWWIGETVPALIREARVLLRKGESEVKRKQAAKWVMKLFCDLLCAVYFTWPLRRRNKRIHKFWSGLLGSIASAMSLHIAWPDNEMVDSP